MSTSRRGLFAAAAALPLAGAAAATDPNPDAALIDLAREYVALSVQERSLYDSIANDEAREEAHEPIWGRQAEIIDLLDDVRAKTPAGLLARVEMIEAYNPPWLEAVSGPDEILAFDLIEDLKALFGGRV